MHYDKNELRALLRGGESHLVEFKRSLGDRRAVRRNICAFANDASGTRKPGVLFIGITIDNCHVAVVQVEPSKSPSVRFDGRVWVKVGLTVQQATLEDEQRLVERRGASNVSFDRQPFADATVDHLDLQYIEEIWVPGADIQCLRFNGTELADPVRKRYEITGKLAYVLKRADDLIDATTSMSVDIVSAGREVRRYDYPPAALMQLESPGGLYGRVTRDKERFGTTATLLWSFECHTLA